MALILVEVGLIEAEEVVEGMNGAVVPQEAICLAEEVTHLLEVADLNILPPAMILDQSTLQVICILIALHWEQSHINIIHANRLANIEKKITE